MGNAGARFRQRTGELRAVERVFVVLSGLPGSGKTSLARPLSAALRLPLLDKDDLLESLFDSLGVATPEERARLSRAADRLLQELAQSSYGAVLSSFWRRERLSQTSGTPTRWITGLGAGRVVEVLCECPPAMAADRYVRRQRHPGHFDSRKTTEELMLQFEKLAAAGPLEVGPLLRVDTRDEVDAAAVAEAVRAAVEDMR